MKEMGHQEIGKIIICQVNHFHPSKVNDSRMRREIKYKVRKNIMDLQVANLVLVEIDSYPYGI